VFGKFRETQFGGMKMNFRIQQHQIQQLASRLNLMVVLVFGLLISNVMLSGLSWYALLHQRVEVTPFMSGSAYQKSDTAVDNRYLMLMSENFLYTRLNVTPENVLLNHRQLLTFVDSQHYTDFANQLSKEAKIIRKRSIASHFNILSIQANPKKLACTIQGILKRSVGIRDLPDESITYTLQFNYHFGRLTIINFTHQAGIENHA
jgi:conjugal transfer pilus assembly protein TraE